MKRLNKNVYWPIVALIILQQYIPSEAFWIIGFAMCAHAVIKNRGLLFIPFSEYKQLFVFLPWGIIIGIVSIGQGKIEVLDLVRDIFYYMNPLIFLFLGACFAKKEINIYRILNAFIISSAIVCLLKDIDIISNMGSLSAALSVYKWRKLVGDGHVVTGVALAITLAKIIPSKNKLPKSVFALSTLLSASYFIISMSRTNILIVAILYFSLMLQKSATKKMLSKIGIGILAVALVIVSAEYVLPKEIVSAFTDKMMGSFSEINSSQSWSSIADIQSNWRGYETNCAMKQWEKENIFFQLVGEGFGRRVEVGNYAYLLLKQVNRDGSPATSIAVLHNGYASQLIKLGLLGVFAYLLFYISIIKKALKHRREKDTLETRLLLGVGLIFMLQTYFLNGLFKDYVFFPTVILMGYTGYKIERNEDFISLQREKQ